MISKSSEAKIAGVEIEARVNLKSVTGTPGEGSVPTKVAPLSVEY